MLLGAMLVACFAPPAQEAEIPTANPQIEAVDLPPSPPPTPQPQPQSDPQPQPESDPQPQPQPQPQPNSQPQPQPQPDYEDDFEDDFEDDYDPLKDSPEAVDARRWRNGGIIALSAGAGLGIGTIILASVDSCTPLAGNNCFGDSKRRSVATMAIPSSILLAAGATLLTVGLVKKARLRASVAADGESAALFISGRF